MADSFIQTPTDGSGKKLDTRTEGSNSEHRQVIVIGDPATNAGVAPVDATKGLAVDLSATGANTNPVKVNIASGGIASGGVASGAIASGAVASGAYASGSISDGAMVTIGAKTDAKSTATDTTSVSAISIWKQISASVQALVSDAFGKGTAGTPSSDVISIQGVASMTPVKVDHSTTGVGHGVKVVTTAGTDVALASSTAAKWVIVQAQTDNTNKIAVGASGVDATEATGTGVLLNAGDSVYLPCDNLADIFIDALVDGEGVRITYGT